MTDDQHEQEQEPDETAEPDGEQEPESDQENDEGEPSRRRGLTVGDMAEAFRKAGVTPLSGFNPGSSLIRQATSRAFTDTYSPLARMLRESQAWRMTNFQSNLISSAVQARLNIPPPFGGLDLRHLMPGGVLSRNEAFRVAGSQLWEALQSLDPENWRGERLDRTAMLRVMEEGIPLVWTPSADLIRTLVAEPDAGTRRTVLKQHADTVVEHCRSVLADVGRTDLKAEVDFLSDCLDSIHRGKYAPAQALASSVLDTVLRALVRADASLQNNNGGFTFRTVAKQLPKATMDTTVGRFRAYCLNTSIHTAYESYFGPPVPKAYNRNATVHGAGLTQITLANALAAVMLAVGLVRELEETQRPLSPAG